MNLLDAVGQWLLRLQACLFIVWVVVVAVLLIALVVWLINRKLKRFCPRDLMMLVLFAMVLGGCSLPCTYHGKPVPAEDAKWMKQQGMDLVCP